MTDRLEILRAGPGLTVQDHGRPGYARFGLSAGGAMDRFALAEGDALLEGRSQGAGIEMSGVGGQFVLHGNPRWCSAAGADMSIEIDGKPVPWRSSFILEPERVLTINTAPKVQTNGTYGYLFIAGGFDLTLEIDAIGTHLRAGIGGLNGSQLVTGDAIPLGSLNNPESGPYLLSRPDYLGTEKIRIVWGAQSDRFEEKTKERLLSESFMLSHRRDRMAMRLETAAPGDPFEALLGGLSDPIQAGDIQMTGDGVPAILMREHQPTGGYPRIASVISADLDAAAQLQTGAAFRFSLVSIDEAIDALRARKHRIERLPQLIRSIVRGPEQIDNLLDYNLIDGVVSAS